MRVVLLVIGVLGLIFGMFVFANAQSAVHEIEGMIAFVIFAVSLAGAGIVSALERLRAQMLIAGTAKEEAAKATAQDGRMQDSPGI